MTQWDITEGIIMKQLFKTLAMLFFVSVLFTNKLNAQMTLEHTFEEDVSVVPFGNYYYSVTDCYEAESATITIYDFDYNLYKQITIPCYQGYEHIGSVYPISPKIIFSTFYTNFEDGCIASTILYDTDGNILRIIDREAYIELYHSLNNKFLLYYYKDGTSYTEVYSVDGYDLNEKIMASSFFGHAYPNPARNTISLPYNLNKGEQAEMLIYDVNGKMIEKKMIDSTFDKILLNVESYTPGIYFYSVNGVSHKFVVR